MSMMWRVHVVHDLMNTNVFPWHLYPKKPCIKHCPAGHYSRNLIYKSILQINRRLNGGELYPLFKNIWAPEEVYFPTALALLGKLGLGGTSEEVVRKSLMWSKWDERSRGSDQAHPIVYDGEFCVGLVNEARAEGCLFMRKWKRQLDLAVWEDVVFGASRDRNGGQYTHTQTYTHTSRNRHESKRTHRDFDTYERSAPMKRHKYGRSTNYY